jgi:hypothetical protein
MVERHLWGVFMFERGNIFTEWGNPSNSEETFMADYENGCHIDIRARQQEPGKVALLVCVYGSDGKMISEETRLLEGEAWTPGDALKWGTDKAERIAGGASGRG